MFLQRWGGCRASPIPVEPHLWRAVCAETCKHWFGKGRRETYWKATRSPPTSPEKWRDCAAGGRLWPPDWRTGLNVFCSQVSCLRSNNKNWPRWRRLSTPSVCSNKSSSYNRLSLLEAVEEHWQTEVIRGPSLSPDFAEGPPAYPDAANWANPGSDFGEAMRVPLPKKYLYDSSNSFPNPLDNSYLML